MSRAPLTIFLTLAIDSGGTGLIMPIVPILPALIRDAVHLAVTAWHYGAFLSLYAAMQFLFAPNLALLLPDRAIAGITGANMSVASAHITDITPEDGRARRFGQMSAPFGVGFILGPILGWFLGLYCVRAPFLAAAVGQVCLPAIGADRPRQGGCGGVLTGASQGPEGPRHFPLARCRRPP